MNILFALGFIVVPIAIASVIAAVKVHKDTIATLKDKPVQMRLPDHDTVVDLNIHHVG